MQLSINLISFKKIYYMGSMSDQMIENQQEKNDEELAEKLGITVEELQEWEEGRGENEDNEGSGLGTWYIEFKDDTPQELKDKIGLDSSNRIAI
jgi:DNA-directed RNA polymerase specialized sigma subunit